MRRGSRLAWREWRGRESTGCKDKEEERKQEAITKLALLFDCDEINST